MSKNSKPLMGWALAALSAAALGLSPAAVAGPRAQAGASPIAVAARPAGPLPHVRPDGITRSEAARLRHQHQQLQQMKRKAGADGEITRREQARIGNQAQKLRELIQKAKTN